LPRGLAYPPRAFYFRAMTNPPKNWFENSISQLNDPQDLRVWSIIVSLFGDLAQRPGERISGSALTRIITPIGIKPEAVRVALHRLRKDGWLDSTRSGRASVHFLTEYGRSQSATVSPRIYARTAPEQQPWHLLIAEGGQGSAALEESLLLPQYFAINRSCALGFGPAPVRLPELLIVTAQDLQVPDWLKTRLFPSDLSASCAQLLRALEAITLADEPSAFESAALRTLIVHHWRRIVLRHPDLPPGFHPAGWPGEACRAKVFELLDQLPPPDPALLAQTAAE